MLGALGNLEPALGPVHVATGGNPVEDTGVGDVILALAWTQRPANVLRSAFHCQHRS